MPYLDCSREETKKVVSEIISKLQEGVEAASKELQIPNLLYNESYVGLIIASILGHKCSITPQGSDALDENDNPVEYKFISRRNEVYTGLSFQFHWLSAEKVVKYQQCTHFYFAWRVGFVVEKIIRVESAILMPEIIAKAGIDGSTKGHKSFGYRRIENLVASRQATVVYPNESVNEN
ncbi:MAG: hypothetical protein K9G41_08410 [Flavobacteriales bacterium]|nr:hypothetical protein [Flavobacteriales bacterium]